MLLLALSIIVSGCRMQDPKPDRIVRFDKPAAYFEEAFPLGNGRIGAMVYGTFPSEHILLNEESLWAGGPVDPNMNPEAHLFLPQVREALSQGEYPLADRLVRNMQGSFSQSFAPLGDLYIDLQHDQGVEDYSRQLDLRRAVALTQYRIGPVTYQRELFVSFPDQQLLIRLSADVPEALNFAVRADSQLRSTVRTTENHDLILSGRAPIHAEPSYRGDIPEPIVYEKADKKGMSFEVHASILETDGNVASSGTTVSVENAKYALIAVALATSFNGFDKEPGTEGKDPGELVRAYLGNTEKRSYRSLKAAHIRGGSGPGAQPALFRSRHVFSAKFSKQRSAYRPAPSTVPGNRGRCRPGGFVLPVWTIPADKQFPARGNTSQSSGYLESSPTPSLEQQLHHQYQCGDELLACRGDQSVGHA